MSGLFGSPLTAAEVQTLADVLAMLDDDAPHAPGHDHERPGVWDADNEPELAGKPCAECRTFQRFRELVARVQRT